ncbi:SLAM family member 8-like [Vicugna pacos]|uniref:SLAM family member 8-like n=1 Tax=Vicugna pacos TaxID=30538 RepID=A0ABM5C2Z0_VICPA
MKRKHSVVMHFLWGSGFALSVRSTSDAEKARQMQAIADQASTQPAMGLCSEGPHRCWASWHLGFISLLLSMCNPGANSSGAHGSGSKDSGNHVYLHKIQGDSVLFHAIKGPEIDPGAKMENVSWGFGHQLNQTIMLSICAGSTAPVWVNLQDKYQKRVRVPNMTSLRIENLSIEDSGLYRVRVTLTEGIEFSQDFYLTVYEPVPCPEILVGSLYITPDCCNITLECRVIGAKKDLNVTWESKGLPKELNHRGTLGPASNSWTLAVSLPLNQSNVSLMCVVNNQVDKKTASKNLAEFCAHGSHGQANTLRGIIGAITAVLLILGSGLYLWKTRGKKKKKKKMETGRGAGSQEDQDDADDSIQYVELSQQESRESTNQGISEQHLREKGPLTIYSELCKPGHAMKII